MHEGRCSCGAVRYRSAEPYAYAVHCHCRACQRSSGAAFMTWVCLPRRGFKLLWGEPAFHRTSERARRAFCRECGAQIFMDYEGSETVDVSLGTLDKPDAIQVLDNIWTSSRLASMRGFDELLPDHPQDAQRGPV